IEPWAGGESEPLLPMWHGIAKHSGDDYFYRYSRNTSMSSKQVAVYGLGNMGFLIAERIARSFSTKVSDLDTARVQQACEDFAAQPVRSDEELSQLGFVVLCLPSPAASEHVLKQIAPHLAPDTIVIETSTVNPEDIKASQKILAAWGLALVD